MSFCSFFFCAGTIGADAAASVVRCSECHNFWHNRSRYINSWRKKANANDTAVVVPVGTLQRSFWHDADDVRNDVLSCFEGSVTEEERAHRLARLSLHLRLEPELRGAVNPTAINATTSIVFCDAADASDHKCTLFSVKQNRYCNQHLCGTTSADGAVGHADTRRDTKVGESKNPDDK